MFKKTYFNRSNQSLNRAAGRITSWYRQASDTLQVLGPLELEEEDHEGEQEPERAQWGNQLEFLMSCIATSVGLGNVWRFPFVAYQNGGGAFIIPYLIVLFLVGKPMYYLECVLGQFSSRNSIRFWSCCPAMMGVGYAQSMACGFILSYYVMITSLCLVYLILSFRSVLPWSVCDPDWVDCVPSNPANFTGIITKNSSSSAELFFINVVLQQSEGVEGVLQKPIWYLTLSLFTSWFGIFMIVARGVKSSGKASYFLALFPYVIMIILLITAVNLPGAGDGITYFVTPRWEKIIQMDVWYAAVTQAFFSLSVCIGAIIMFSSYNGFTQNVYRDSVIVTTLDTLTSLLSGVTIFGILGNLAHNLNTKVDEVVGSGGTGLAFISYPDAIAKTPMPQLYSIMFFIMMTVLGFGSAVALLSAINTVLLDAFPKVRTVVIAATSCSAGFIIGIVYTTPGGQFVLELVDYYGGTFLVLYTAIAEVIGVFWIYGLESFCIDVEFMLKKKPSKYWRICWGILTPGLMMLVFLYSLMSLELLVVGGTYYYPTAGYVAGYLMLISGILVVPIFIAKSLYHNRTGDIKKTFKKAFHSKPTWGPRFRQDAKKWKEFKNRAQLQHSPHKCTHICKSLCGSYNTSSNPSEESITPTTTTPKSQTTMPPPPPPPAPKRKPTASNAPPEPPPSRSNWPANPFKQFARSSQPPSQQPSLPTQSQQQVRRPSAISPRSPNRASTLPPNASPPQQTNQPPNQPPTLPPNQPPTLPPNQPSTSRRTDQGQKKSEESQSKK